MASRALTKALKTSMLMRPARTMASAAAAAPQTSPTKVDVSKNVPQKQSDQQQQRQLGRLGAGLMQPGGIFDLWSPIASSRSLRQMLDSMNRVLDVDFSGVAPEPSARGRSPWDIVEKDDSYYLRIDLPGFDKSDLKIKVEGDDELVIQAEHKGEDDVFGVQRSLNTRMLLPPEAVKDKIKAELKNGVLTICVPKDVSVIEKKQVEVNVE